MKEAEVAANERTTIIIAKKSQGEIEIVSKRNAEVLGPVESIGTGGTEGENDVGNGFSANRVMDAGMWGSSIGTIEGGGSFTGSLSGMGGAPSTNWHFLIVKIVVQT